MSRATMLDPHPEEENVDNVENEANEIQQELRLLSNLNRRNLTTMSQRSTVVNL